MIALSPAEQKRTLTLVLAPEKTRSPGGPQTVQLPPDLFKLDFFTSTMRKLCRNINRGFAPKTTGNGPDVQMG